MKSREPSLVERMSTSAKAKQAQLERARAKSPANDPKFAERQEARRAIGVAREARATERKAAKLREAEDQAAAEVVRASALKTEQATREAELVEQKSREVAQSAAQKAARDARYAARKARKR
jgi:hypothetical protein